VVEPSTCRVLCPKTRFRRIGGAGVTLKWKTHPQADEYRVYLKGAKAATAILSFESVTGTSYPLTQKLPPDMYFWTVNAHKGSDQIAASPLQNFTVK